eukprot:TRINITY_DN43622_c0_g2_i1.p1 TRINITY_DN43622_c0_g2~~TRINITY_DN43622_c0_g2_i1.p1  ORF type:complete len:204 (+),score=44.29 TRINITY_DN43622_c0_g2_i1:174-785(+)
MCIRDRYQRRVRGHSDQSDVMRACRLLVVWHSRTGFAERMSEAVMGGARVASEQMGGGLTVERVRAREVTPVQMLESRGFVFVSPENLAAISGEMKEFFDTMYYQMLREDGTSHLLGRPYGIAVGAGSDGHGAASQMARICTGWRLQPVVAHPVICCNGLVQSQANIMATGKGELLSEADRARCEELGGTVAASILLSHDADA